MSIDSLLVMVDEAEQARRKAAEARGRIPSLPHTRMRQVYESCAGGRKLTAWERKKVLFVLLVFLSPMTLTGERLRPGMRDRIARMMHASPSGVSRDARKVVFYYRHYPAFRSDVDGYYEGVLRSLEEKNRNT